MFPDTSPQYDGNQENNDCTKKMTGYCSDNAESSDNHQQRKSAPGKLVRECQYGHGLDPPCHLKSYESKRIERTTYGGCDQQYGGINTNSVIVIEYSSKPW